MRLIKKEEVKTILEYRYRQEGKIESAVKKIIKDIREYGDKKLISYTKDYDKVKIKKIALTEKDLEKSFNKMPGELKNIIDKIAGRIRRYHKKQQIKEFVLKERGMKIQFKVRPIDMVGVYTPAGQNPLISSILMSVIPAQSAGVKKIIACSPPLYNNDVHPYIAGTLYYLGVKDVFRVGGAQAIAAMAYGTESIPKVEKIVGPGNIYVNMAKKIVSGTVGIDLLAGPSELVVISDDTGNPRFISADINAQTEHRDGFGIFLTTSERIGKEVSSRVEKGCWIKLKNIEEAIEIVNAISPEHLQVILKEPSKIVEKIKAGAIFMGNYTPCAAGDYFLGPSHILPTGGRAAFESGLSVFDFLRTFAIMEGRKEYFKRCGYLGEYLADKENLGYHKISLELRRKT